MDDVRLTNSDPGAALHRWLPIVARRAGKTARPVTRGVEIEVDGSPADGTPAPRPVLLASAPADDEERHARYRHALAPAARALLSAHACVFSSRLPEDPAAGEGEPVRVLRCALGVFDPALPLRLRRLTAIHVDPWDRVRVWEGGDRLFEQIDVESDACGDLGPAPRRSLDERLAALREAVERWHRSDLEMPAVRRRIAPRVRRRQREIRELETFYRAGRNRVALRGVETLPDDRANDAESEHRRRLLDVVRRYDTGLAVHVLSLGEVACRARRPRSGDEWWTSLPFV